MTSKQPDPQQPLAGAPEQPAPEGEPAPAPQWIPATPPPNPYAASQSAPRRPGGKGIAIIAMALGLTALLTVLVSVGYFNAPVVVVGGLLGTVAIALGIVAAAKKFRPLGAGITGIATGALAMFAASALVGIALTTEGFGTGGAFAPPSAPDSAEQAPWQPDSEQTARPEWPANMQSGGIVFTGPGDPRPVESAPLPVGSAPIPHQIDREHRNDILIYVDYSCPHCGVFEQQNDKFLTALIDAGDTTVEVVPLSFMDRYSEGSYYSSRAAAAVACFADSQPETAWAADRALLSADLQSKASQQVSNDQLLRALEQHVGTVNSSVRECVSNETFVQFAQEFNDWVFRSPVPHTASENVRIQGTPTIFVNGIVYPGNPSDPAEFKAFFEEQAH